MKENNFREWMTDKQITKKMQSDLISRLRRIEKEIKFCNIDKEYKKDQCKCLLSFFENMGVNKKMNSIAECNFPIGKYHMNTFRYAINKYVQFKNETLSKAIDE